MNPCKLTFLKPNFIHSFAHFARTLPLTASLSLGMYHMTASTTVAADIVDKAAITMSMESTENELSRLKNGLKQLNYLLSHWEEKTSYCNFGEFQRELLLPENKEKLMKAAAEGGLLDYDKSATMNVMCRQDPEMVRAFVGLKEDNPTLRNAETLLRKPTTLQQIDSDSLDMYIDAVEAYAQAIAEVGSLTYEARTDFLSQETNSKEALAAQRAEGRSNYLEQSRYAVIAARDALQSIVNMLHL